MKEKPHPYLERMNLLLKRFQIFPVHSVAIPLTIQFLFSTFVAFLIPALISYLHYGDSYLKEAILYHFGRFFATFSKIYSITLGLTQSITSLHSTFGFTLVRLTATASVVVFCSQLLPQPLRWKHEARIIIHSPSPSSSSLHWPPGDFLKEIFLPVSWFYRIYSSHSTRSVTPLPHLTDRW